MFQSRREWLTRAALGFGGLALRAGEPLPPQSSAKATSVIFLYMDGGPSQVDTFDHKPLLQKYQGQDPGKLFKVEATQFNNIGRVMASPWKFRQHGESGAWVSDLFPHIAGCVDDLAFIHSMSSKFPEHTSANYFLHTGSALQGRPSMGAWASYGLGSFNQNLPSFLVLNGGLIPAGGRDNFASGFLPAAHQGSIFRGADPPVANLKPGDAPERQRGKLNLIEALDRGYAERLGHPDEVESAIRHYETAFRMQTAIPELMDIGGESAATKRLYGLEAAYAPTQSYGRICLTARRLVERGARFVEVTCPNVGHDRWDQHQNLKKGHDDNARAVDQPIAALLRDLKARGLLETTLVLWGGEFGRTPFAQGGDGRDHNPYGYTMWMAGGGIKGGVHYGETDEFGYKAVKQQVELHDLHATILHLLGFDHTKLTFRFGGRDMRLTDVHGEVVRELIG